MTPAASYLATGDEAEAGFSLVELLVALAIVAAMAGAFAGALAQNAAARRMAQLRSQALMVAQSRLDGAIAGDDAQGAAGQAGALTWRIDRNPYGPLDPLDRHPLEQVRVTVEDATHRSLITLSSVRIVP